MESGRGGRTSRRVAAISRHAGARPAPADSATGPACGKGLRPRADGRSAFAARASGPPQCRNTSEEPRWLRIPWVRLPSPSALDAENPAEVLLGALAQDDLEPRLVEALPWLVLRYSTLDWSWVVREAKVRDLQNRLGFVVGLARQLAVRV